jgi:transcriptional regulator with XRE-family HTH domain
MDGATGAQAEMERFGALLKRHRDEIPLTQAELAERAKPLTAQAISLLERGKRRPGPATVSRLAKALELDDGQRATFVLTARQAGDPDAWAEPWTRCRNAPQVQEVPSNGLEWALAVVNALADSVVDAVALPYGFMPASTLTWVVRRTAALGDLRDAGRHERLMSAASHGTVAAVLGRIEPDLACRILAQMPSRRAWAVWELLNEPTRRAVREASRHGRT